ncbi:DNA-binding response regulator [Shewanella colwelliana]|uniref:DNA-binding response regulator n=1 Tax=Shewanella colwelliana TaxID=23 RepID=A0ABQ4P4C2_SHECO|nr:response regulator [Shewanella colwelliana]GIU42332.1 DNA-binding response regulator [Shewanella colwelliana]
MVELSSKVLIVDGDIDTRTEISAYLTQQGVEVFCASNGKQMDSMLEQDTFHLLLLELKLNGEDGLAICRRLRQANNNIPIVLKSNQCDEIDRIIGLEIGADDFLPQPCNQRELLARIHAVIRRKAPRVNLTPKQNSDEFHFGEFTLNLSTRKMYRGKNVIALTSSEFAIMQVFAKHPTEPLSREKLASLTRGREHLCSNRAIDVQISRLRRLIEIDSTNPDFIQTVWGLGYVFIPDSIKRKAMAS